MKIRCIKTQIEGNPREQYDNKLNIGDEFYVYGLTMSQDEMPYVTIYLSVDLFDHLAIIPLELFEIIDDKIPDSWRIRQYYSNDISLYPDFLLQNDFMENFSEHEPKERAEFAEFRKIYEK